MLGRDEPLPLMPDWSNALCSALDAIEPRLASACHLQRGMTGEAFEEALGALLQWRQVRALEERFSGLGGPAPGQQLADVINARERATGRLAQIVEAVNVSLYEQFGQARIDEHLASDAYRKLFKALGKTTSLVVATTNYDRSAEAALSILGHSVDTGFQAATTEWTPSLQVRGLLLRAEEATPVLHLHGAVGWYQRDGTVYDHRGDQPFNSSLGTPVVLYPDPDKDPTNDAIVSDIWSEFDAALQWANAILVMGHSLHDPALLRALSSPRVPRVAVTFYAPEEEERIKSLLPRAQTMGMVFGPDLSVDQKTLRAFLDTSISARTTFR